MMYCLRRYEVTLPALFQANLPKPSYIPLLLLPLPLSLSPIHLTILLILTYTLNRPCIYCSFLLLILFGSSCQWSGRCFIDFNYEEGIGYASWFLPRLYTSPGTAEDALTKTNESFAEFFAEVTNSTASALAAAAFEGVKARISRSPETITRRASEHAGIGIGWLKSLFGRNEWILPCIDVKLAL